MNVFEEFKRLVMELEKYKAWKQNRKKEELCLRTNKDLIWLKRTRNSKQDQADIEKLEDDKNR